MEKLKVILCKTNEAPKVVELPKKHDYRDIKKLLELDGPLDCVERKIGGYIYDFWVDDEGLLKEKKNVTAICTNASELLCGNILIAKHNSQGELLGLGVYDIKRIMNGSKNWVPNKQFIEYCGVKIDEKTGDAGFIKNYNGFGKIDINANGKMLKYEC